MRSLSGSSSKLRKSMKNASEYEGFIQDLIDSLYLDDDKAAFDVLVEKYPSVELGDYDGFRLSHLILMKLRFERLTRSSMEAMKEFEFDEKSFVEEFKRYHHSVKPVYFFPPEEADAFDRFRA